MSQEKKLVSVIIPAYQHQEYICECIESVLAQTYPLLELILIDDSSTDGTMLAAESMRERCEHRFVRTIIMSKEKSGVASSCNLGIEMAHGEYIYLIASDDVALPHTIETLATVLDTDEDCVLAVGDNAFIDSRSSRIGWDKERNAVSLGNAEFKTFGDYLGLNNAGGTREHFGTYGALLRDNHVPNGYIMRRSALLQAGGYKKEAILEDWHMNLQLSKIGSMRYIPEVLFLYRWHARNTIKKYENLKSHEEVYRKICSMEHEYALSHGYGKILKRRDPDSLRNRYHRMRRRLLLAVNALCYINKKKRILRLGRFEFHW